ncbi:MAG: 5-methyltetrahydropteroyltriglutamate--homocysteine S-methyltransferase [Rhizobiales bacterium]|nr:5-methyltetrahydropteroyltriglutamate--homocysteine S-methyltransferase [Hyphomicrobiales bacterium]
MQRELPPYRADHVGSLLRTPALKQARGKFAAGQLSAAELKAVEDSEIKAIIDKQEAVGLRSVTDGEFRRAYWHFDFLAGLDGVEMVAAEGIKFAGVQSKAEAPFVKGKLGSRHHPQIEHFAFLKANTKCTPKMTIPSPSMLHYRGGRKMIDRAAYPGMDEFYRDLGQAYKQAIQGFYAAGCRYLQLDDCSFAYLCDPAQRDMLAKRGDDPAKQGEIYAGMINAALDGRPRDLVVTTHVCRGNFRSTFIASGGYEPIADLLFNGVNVDGYFLEWDNDRAGGFEPLRFLPKDKTVVLGLITSKTGALEEKDMLKRRIAEAAKYAPLDRLCLSPQCGFASTEEGNVLSEQEQWAKLRLAVDVAAEVWGR